MGHAPTRNGSIDLSWDRASQAWQLIADALQDGQVRCRAMSVTSHLAFEEADVLQDGEVPSDLWRLGGVPAPGHVFWTTGDVNTTVAWPGTVPASDLNDDPFALGAIAPHVEVRGALLDRAGLDLLVYGHGEFSRQGASKIALSDQAGLAGHRSGRRLRGRPPGSGSLHASDAPLLACMKLLIDAGTARSVYHAAQLVAAQAEGGGLRTSKERRLMRRLRSCHPSRLSSPRARLWRRPGRFSG